MAKPSDLNKSLSTSQRFEHGASGNKPAMAARVWIGKQVEITDKSERIGESGIGSVGESAEVSLSLNS